MKSLRTLSVLLASILTVAILSIPATAHTEDVQPYATMCNCGGTFITSTVWGSWYNSHEEKCTHCNYGTDMIQKRSGTQTMTCNSCGQGSSKQVSQERRVCHGYNS